MTDFPTKSQPSQYFHLAVIRETSITHRQTHYHYFSYGWHQELVKEGLAVEPWVITGKKKGLKTGSLAENDDKGLQQPEFDEFGFPPVDTGRLLNKDSIGSLAASQAFGRTKNHPKKGKPAGTNTREYIIWVRALQC